MNRNPLTKSLRKFVLAISVTTLAHSFWTPAYCQPASEPEREQLLNGLRVLLWTRPVDQDVLIKLRIHSGAAFDVAGKAGGMAILGDILFPDPTTREYFTDDMAGRLDVDTDYDAITVTMQGRASELVRIVEILRTALTATQITENNVAKLREGRIKIAKETTISPAILADRAIATRLFGDFPYGRPSAGSVETLSRIDRADLLLARGRFLNPNNATLVIIGGIKKNHAMRALRQLLGSWRKSEEIVPATFRQADPPDTRTLIINAPTDQSAEVRLAVRGLARSDSDYSAAAIVAIIARKRWEASSAELSRSPLSVRNEAHVLPGMFVMGAAIDTLMVGKTLKAARDVLNSMVTSPVTSMELEQARNEVLMQITKERERPDGVATSWLDMDTYGLPAPSEQNQRLSAVSAGDVQRAATRLVGNAHFASIIIGDSKQLKAQLEPTVKIELMGEVQNRPPEKTEAKPITTIPVKKPD